MSAPTADDRLVKPWAVIAYLCGDNPNLHAHVRKQQEAILAFQGSDRFHVAAQWDLPGEGATRSIMAGPGTWKTERLGRVNTGDPAAFLDFLRWAFDRCPAERVMVVVSGTGLLDSRAARGSPATDRAHLFTVCDDATAGDALSLSELGPMLQQAVAIGFRDRIDILALDLRELQCLEVAYELEGIVEFLIAPQTRVPDSGWNFDVVLRDLDAALAAADPMDPQPALQIAKRLVQTVGAAYEASHQGHLSLSALNLHTLKNFASAFDMLSVAMVHSVGEELVWEARVAVAQKLKPGDPSASSKGPPQVALHPQSEETIAESEYLYDLLEMIGELRTQMAKAAETGLFRLLSEHLEGLDLSSFKRAVESIDSACFMRRGARPSRPPSLADPAAARRRLRALIEQSASPNEGWVVDTAKRARGLAELFTDPALTAPGVHSWLDALPAETIAGLEPALAATYMAAERQRQRLKQLAAMADRVLNLLQTGAGGSSQTPIGPLVVAHFTSRSESPTRHGGVSLYRPRNLDQLIASDYLKLRFNQKIHWTVLLAVINLIGSHPRALWRILSALLATADNSTRAQLIDRITGPGSVIAPFRDQFVVLAPVKAYVLSLEPEPTADEPAAGWTPTGTSRPHAYRVRLELAEREAFISEFRSIVDPDALEAVINELVSLLEPGTPLTAADATRIESLGETLGEDILQELGVKLTEGNQSPDQIHLQLQIPRELMRYPWELMHYKDGWLSEKFAMGRQVFSRLGGGRMRSRVPGPLRALVIGNPPTKEQTLPYAAQEAEEIAAAFAAVAAETDGLLDFDRDRDAFINRPVTRAQVRELLRHGNYDIIHFAGHAAFDAANTGASAWLLSDGRLSARAIRNTLRWRDTQPWLVYANACEAGMDAGKTPPMYQNEVFGLASAFLDHGVSVFIGPLWRIDDRIASNIAKSFYQQLLKERQTVGEALRRAKAEAKAAVFGGTSASTTASPSTEGVLKLSWAGLVLYGNSTAGFGQRIGAPPPPEPSEAHPMDERA